MKESRIVVGVDGSAASREALRWAARLTSALGGEIVVVHALGLVEQIGGRTIIGHRLQGQMEDIVEREWCATLRGHGTPFRIVVREGCPVDVLVAVAREERARLVVLGSRGIGTTPALCLGSTSLHVLQIATLPVLVIPDREEGGPHLGMRRILVGVDATSATPATEWACELAEAFGALVDLVNAVEDVPVFPLGPATAVTCAGESDAPAEARHRLERLRRAISARGIPVQVRVERGAPDEVVRSTAALIDADLVVVGSEHVGHPEVPLLEDSVSRRIVSVAHRPTLVVPTRPVAAAPRMTMLETAPAGRGAV